MSNERSNYDDNPSASIARADSIIFLLLSVVGDRFDELKRNEEFENSTKEKRKEERERGRRGGGMKFRA